MILVREVFVAKPGQASKLARLMKQAFAESKSRVMTDLVGEYNTVVVETEMNGLADFDKMMEEYKTGKIDPKMQEAMKDYTQMYQSGCREIYQIW